MDKERFKATCQRFRNFYEKNGIGTYKEKTLHKVVKNYYENDINYQEVKIDKYVADICKDNKIIEIQTRSFNKLYPKLEYFCKNYEVTIVYPIAYHKWLTWIDTDVGMVTKRRKSPKIGTIYDAFVELYKIKVYLVNPNCHIILLFIDVDEFRNLNGWSENKKRGSSREDQIPCELIDEVRINDFNVFIPKIVPETFTAIEYAKCVGISVIKARVGMTILQYVGCIEAVGKNGKSNIYRRKKVEN